MQSDDPVVLFVGTEVSAKYRGAFCEAKIKKVLKCVKCKVVMKDNAAQVQVSDEDIKGNLKMGATVEIRHGDSSNFREGTLMKITDASVYTVVFNDGDENTLRRTQLCLKGEKHFVRTETLDELPLTNPEQFGTPVMRGSKMRKRQLSVGSSDLDDDSDVEDECRRIYPAHLHGLIGRVLLMELEDRKKTSWVPVLVVQPDADDQELKTREHLLVKSFKDSKFFTVAKKDTKEFVRETALKNEDKLLKATFEKALAFFDNHELPQGWDKDELIVSDSDDDRDYMSSDDEPNEEKDYFVAQLYKFMDDRGTPINKAPIICNKDLDLFRLYQLVDRLGGYNRVTNEMKWRSIHGKLRLPPSANAANQVKAAYKKYLRAFQDFYRKLGSTMGSVPGRSRPASSRNILSPRDRESTPRLSRTVVKKAVGRDDEKDVKREEKEKVTRSKASGAKDDDEENEVSCRISFAKTEIGTEESPRRPTRFAARLTDAKDDKAAVMTSLLSGEVSSSGIREQQLQHMTSRPHTREVARTKDELVKRQERTGGVAAGRGGEEMHESSMMINAEINSDEQEEGETESEEKRSKLKTRRKVTDAEKCPEEENIEHDEKKTTAKKRASLELDGGSTIKIIEREKESQKSSAAYVVGTMLSVRYGDAKNDPTYDAKLIDLREVDGETQYMVHYCNWNSRYDEWIKKERIAGVKKEADAVPAAKDSKPRASQQVYRSKQHPVLHHTTVNLPRTALSIASVKVCGKSEKSYGQITAKTLGGFASHFVSKHSQLQNTSAVKSSQRPKRAANDLVQTERRGPVKLRRVSLTKGSHAEETGHVISHGTESEPYRECVKREMTTGVEAVVAIPIDEAKREHCCESIRSPDMPLLTREESHVEPVEPEGDQEDSRPDLQEEEKLDKERQQQLLLSSELEKGRVGGRNEDYLSLVPVPSKGQLKVISHAACPDRAALAADSSLKGKNVEDATSNDNSERMATPLETFSARRLRRHVSTDSCKFGEALVPLTYKNEMVDNYTAETEANSDSSSQDAKSGGKGVRGRKRKTVLPVAHCEGEAREHDGAAERFILKEETITTEEKDEQIKLDKEAKKSKKKKVPTATLR